MRIPTNLLSRNSLTWLMDSDITRGDLFVNEDEGTFYVVIDVESGHSGSIVRFMAGEEVGVETSNNNKIFRYGTSPLKPFKDNIISGHENASRVQRKKVANVFIDVVSLLKGERIARFEFEE